jgi:PAS domain S-box-containing protein
MSEVDRLFTLTPDLIVVLGFDRYFKRVNPTFEARLGYTEQEALLRPSLEFVHPDDRERTERLRRRLRDGEVNVSFENRYVCKDGSYRWIEWTGTPVLEEGLIYAVGRDVTDRGAVSRRWWRTACRPRSCSRRLSRRSGGCFPPSWCSWAARSSTAR